MAMTLPYYRRPSIDIRRSEAPSQSGDKTVIRALRNNLQGRTATLPCPPDCEKQQRDRDGKVLPSVQRPLALPAPLPSIRERKPVRDWPLVAVGAARPDHIASQI